MPQIIQRNKWAGILKSLDYNVFALFGGRQSSKTTEGCDATVEAGVNQFHDEAGNPQPANMVVTRWIQKNIKHSLKPALEKSFRKFNLDNAYAWDKTYKEFHTQSGNIILPKGMWNSFDDFKGLENFYWHLGDEAQFYPLDQVLEIHDTQSRFNGWKSILLGNGPDSPVAAYFRDQHAKGAPGVYYEEINYEKNAFLPMSSKLQIAKTKAFDFERYEHEFCNKPAITTKGQVYQRGIHWEEGNLDAEVEKHGHAPLFGIDHGGWGGDGGGGGSPTVAIRLYCWPDPENPAKWIVYVQKTRHAFGLADKHIAPLMAGTDSVGDSMTAPRWTMPHEDQYGDTPFDGLMDATEFGATIFTDHREASEAAMRQAGMKVVKQDKPANCELHRTNWIRNNCKVVVNYEKIPDTDIRECEQAFIDMPKYSYAPIKGQPGSFDFTKFASGSDHMPDAMAAALNNFIFAGKKKKVRAIGAGRMRR